MGCFSSAPEEAEKAPPGDESTKMYVKKAGWFSGDYNVMTDDDSPATLSKIETTTGPAQVSTANSASDTLAEKSRTKLPPPRRRSKPPPATARW